MVCGKLAGCSLLEEPIEEVLVVVLIKLTSLNIHVSSQAQRTRGITKIPINLRCVKRMRHARLEIESIRRLLLLARLILLGEWGSVGFDHNRLRSNLLDVFAAAIKHTRGQPRRHNRGVTRAWYGTGEAPRTRVVGIAIVAVGEGAAGREQFGLVRVAGEESCAGSGGVAADGLHALGLGSGFTDSATATALLGVCDGGDSEDRYC
mmetsp:Transcript_17629/g.28510  ORF Transcript_17629/g.28510 Transcript_17629/m.28510 type:complete len:206 (+) Transcript_17629:1810-2427(+)